MKTLGITDRDNVLVVAHDAGGANILAHLVKANQWECGLSLSGPAVNIFNEVFSREFVSRNTREFDSSFSVILTGSSVLSDFEWNIMKEAAGLDICVVSFLDNWTNYRERFIRQGVTLEPTKIVVGDPHACALAVDLFPHTTVIQIDNPYTEYILEELKVVVMNTIQDRVLFQSPEMVENLLYVSEPAGSLALNEDKNEGVQGYTEFDALLYFLNNAKMVFPKLQHIRLRVHPSESKSKYDSVIAAQVSDAVTVSTGTLYEDLFDSDAVVGTHSNVLALALLAGITSVSAIPLGGVCCQLPHEEILKFEDLM